MQHPSRRAQFPAVPGVPCPRGSAPAAPAPGRLAVSCAPGDDRVRVTLRGELDLVSGNRLRGRLSEALAASASGLDLHLSGLSFCDCAGLSVLMELRRRALSASKTVVIQDPSPAIDRLLHLIGAQDLFSPSCSRPSQMHAAV
ncbi:STAS domain-containing protein [Streptomyces collinus]|uniref:STAS domain-containing protein n=1 Tax=Streptomyces collinus TaxID=42684 RepID=UPI000998E3EC|nr:STAS domain-containing protein [Streptomyces collinus]